ncbi:MAG: hypothetical protein DI539_10670 [Flavobacterium psychrophilum]|nr:MAG: hypothetical protein DI539_10670 [Flavobacterium psychrophilum]
MTDNPQYEADYQRGFNDGYILTQHKPELAAEISKIETETPRIEGMKDGRKQYALDLTREHRPKWMREDRFNTPAEPDKGKDMDLEAER